MKTLLVLRHAKSSRDDPTLPDHERPLNARGRRDAPRMGRLIAEQDIVPALVVSSSAVRARATATEAADAAGADSVQFTDSLYLAGVGDFISVLNAVQGGPDRVMVVAHNPGIEQLVQTFGGVHERMPTAALAQLELDLDDWGDLARDTPGRLTGVWRPKELR